MLREIVGAKKDRESLKLLKNGAKKFLASKIKNIENLESVLDGLVKVWGKNVVKEIIEIVVNDCYFYGERLDWVLEKNPSELTIWRDKKRNMMKTDEDPVGYEEEKMHYMQFFLFVMNETINLIEKFKYEIEKKYTKRGRVTTAF